MIETLILISILTNSILIICLLKLIIIIKNMNFSNKSENNSKKTISNIEPIINNIKTEVEPFIMNNSQIRNIKVETSFENKRIGRQ